MVFWTAFTLPTDMKDETGLVEEFDIDEGVA